MTQNYSEPFSNIPQDSEALRSVPNDSETVRTFPKDSEADGSVPQRSEDNGTIPHRAESVRNVPQDVKGREDHTLTVQEVARMFEAAGVPRTERCIVNWCHRHGNDIGRLDCVMDGNERRYFITTESVERAIVEERSKAARGAEKFGSVRHDENGQEDISESSGSAGGGKETTRFDEKLRDLEITNRVKDKYIEKLESERTDFVDRLMSTSRRIGELETRLQIEGPRMTGRGTGDPEIGMEGSALEDDRGSGEEDFRDPPEENWEA